ncbi:MAG: hypothetical protein VR66_22850 [Peptococcaceae bacterium BRH_c23]|nr:MAG: hypothetical protein VR66_22850 [Peptococcaceae bacterium BRH_c23]
MLLLFWHGYCDRFVNKHTKGGVSEQNRFCQWWLDHFKNPLGIVTAFIAGVSIIIFDYLAKKTGKSVISEFSFPVSMVIGMSSAVLVNNLF